MKILLVNSHKIGGVEYYRAMKPSHVLTGLHPEYLFTSVNIIHPTEDVPAGDITISDEWLKQFDLVHFIRQIGYEGWTEGIAKRLNKLGIPFGLDLDDYWHLPDNHIIANEYRQFNVTQTIIDSIKVAHFVTTTTVYLADEIKQLNKNVYILENGIDTEDESWQIENTYSQLMRFGLMVGSTHIHDIDKAVPSCLNILRTEKKAQIVLAGFGAKLGEPSYYIGMEKKLTDNHNVLPKSYSQYLKSCSDKKNELFINMNYFRLWGVPVKEWGHQYKYIDVSLVPLADNKFNNCKSELKLIEAGFKGKAAIVSNIKPYTLLATDKNAYLVNKASDFQTHIRRCLNEPNEVADKIAQLHEDTKKYSLQLLTQKRKELYDSCK